MKLQCRCGEVLRPFTGDQLYNFVFLREADLHEVAERTKRVGFAAETFFDELEGRVEGRVTRCPACERIWLHDPSGSRSFAAGKDGRIPIDGALETASRVEAQRGFGGQDRVGVFPRGAIVACVVADGAGGTAGGAAAATRVIDRFRELVVGTTELMKASTWKGCLELLADELVGVGQTTAVVAATDGDVVVGASVGDSAAWLVGADELRDLTEGQRRKPLLGGGAVDVHVFERTIRPGDRLLLATDGLVKYTSAERIGSVLRQPESLEVMCAALVALVRLPSGALQDDVGFALVRVPSS